MKILLIILSLIILTTAYCDVLTLDQIKDLVLDNNPDFKGQEEATKASEAQYYNSYTNLLPSASAKGSYSTNEPGLKHDSYGVTASYALFNGGKNIINIFSTKNSHETGKNNLSKTELNTLTTAEKKYYTLLQSKQYLNIAQMDYEISQSLLKIGETKHKFGTLSNSDLLKLQSDNANKEVSVIQNQYTEDLNFIDLASYLQIEQDFEIAPLDTISVIKEIETIASLSEEDIKVMIENLVSYGIDHNYDLKNSEISLENAKLNLWQSIGNFLPTVSLSVDKTWQKSELENDYTDTQSLYLTASIPIFPIADNGINLVQSKYNIKHSNYNLISAKSSLNITIKREFYNLLTAAKSVKSARTSLKYSRELYEQNFSYYKNNMISTSELLDASLLLSNNNYQYYASIYSFLMHKSELLNTLATNNDTILTINN